jgi:hypothetical protein
MWVIFIIEFRLVEPAVEMINVEWGLALHMIALFLVMLPLEKYIEKSSRFKWSDKTPYHHPFLLSCS